MIYYHCDTCGEDMGEGDTEQEVGQHFCQHCEMPVWERDTEALTKQIEAFRPIVEVVASLNLSDIGSMKSKDILYWHGGKLTVAHVRQAVTALAAAQPPSRGDGPARARGGAG